MLAETGLIGAAAFIFLLGAIWVNYRRTVEAGAGVTDPTLRVLAGLARAVPRLDGLTFCRGNRHAQFLSVQLALAGGILLVGGTVCNPYPCKC